MPRGQPPSARGCSLQECRRAKFSAPVGAPQAPSANISALSTQMAFRRSISPPSFRRCSIYELPLSHILELIVSGPEVPGVPVGDTFSAMHALVQTASQEVIVAGYSIYNGKEVFESLAQRMESIPELRVTFLVHIGREGKDTTIETDLVARYANWFVSENWPGKRLPDMYYGPRGLQMAAAMRSNFHPKCLLVDAEEALVTSANFTIAAQKKNVEVGVKISPILVARLRTYFLSLVERGDLKRVYLPRDSR